MAKIIVFVICLLFTTFSNTIPQEARAGGFSVRNAGGFSVRQKGLKNPKIFSLILTHFQKLSNNFYQLVSLNHLQLEKNLQINPRVKQISILKWN